MSSQHGGQAEHTPPLADEDLAVQEPPKRCVGRVRGFVHLRPFGTPANSEAVVVARCSLSLLTPAYSCRSQGGFQPPNVLLLTQCSVPGPTTEGGNGSEAGPTLSQNSAFFRRNRMVQKSCRPCENSMGSTVRSRGERIFAIFLLCAVVGHEIPPPRNVSRSFRAVCLTSAPLETRGLRPFERQELRMSFERRFRGGRRRSARRADPLKNLRFQESASGGRR